MVLADLTITRPGLSSGLSHLEDNMTLEDITYDDVIEEAYDDYIADCDEVGTEPLDLDKWIESHEGIDRINKWCRSLGLRKEQR